MLDRDVSNKWKNLDQVAGTQQFTNTIPFLRATDSEWKSATRSPSKSIDYANQTYTAGFNAPQQVNIVNAKKRMRQVRRENGWDSYIKPISKYNEQVHPSMKISFERI